MIETFTLDELILYYFNETRMSESVLIQRAIDTDEETEEEFNAIVKTMQKLDGLLVNPSADAVDAIMNYSKSTSKVLQ